MPEEKLEAVEIWLRERLSFPVATDSSALQDPPPASGLYWKTPQTLERLKEAISRLKIEEGEMKAPFPDHLCYWPKSKALWDPLGFLYLSSQETPGLLRIQKRLEELEEEIATQRRLWEAKISEIKTLEAEKRELEEELKKTRKAREALEKEIRGLRQETQGLRLARERLQRREELWWQERRLAQEQKQKLESELESCRQKVEELSEGLKGLLKEEEASRGEFQSLKKELERGEKGLREKGRRLSELSERLKWLSKRQKELEENLRRSQERLRQITQQERLLEDELAFVRGRLQKEKEERREVEKKKAGLEKEKEALERALRETQEQLEGLEQEGKALEKDRERLREKIHRLELDLAEAQLTLEHLRREAQENLGTDLEDFVRNRPPQGKLETIEREIAEAREKLAQFQAVNLAAQEELARVKERYHFLLEQKEDLLQSLRDLEKARQRLDEESRRRLEEALKAANQKLAEVFPLLFEGGRAELIFTDSEDPLKAGLDLKVKLPGKPVKHLALLSGGEKALCALAVLFSFYLVKPGPFCILDEVDAPLDESNTLKFNTLLKRLRQYSQIILVTHNPQVMEIADALFGVTMEEKGVSKIVSVKWV